MSKSSPHIPHAIPHSRQDVDFVDSQADLSGLSPSPSSFTPISPALENSPQRKTEKEWLWLGEGMIAVVNPDHKYEVYPDPNTQAVDDLKKEAWKHGGVVEKCRQLGHELLALITINRELYFLATNQDSSQKKWPRDLRDRVYLVLKSRQGGLDFLGGRHADTANDWATRSLYNTLLYPSEFRTYSGEIDATVDAEDTRVQKYSPQRTHCPSGSIGSTADRSS